MIRSPASSSHVHPCPPPFVGTCTSAQSLFTCRGNLSHMLQSCYRQGKWWDKPPLYMGGEAHHGMTCQTIRSYTPPRHTPDTTHRPSISIHIPETARPPPPPPGGLVARRGTGLQAGGVCDWAREKARPDPAHGRTRTGRFSVLPDCRLDGQAVQCGQVVHGVSVHGGPLILQGCQRCRRVDDGYV